MKEPCALDGLGCHKRADYIAEFHIHEEDDSMGHVEIVALLAFICSSCRHIVQDFAHEVHSNRPTFAKWKDIIDRCCYLSCSEKPTTKFDSEVNFHGNYSITLNNSFVMACPIHEEFFEDKKEIQ